jgi:hypothetical protein
MWREKGVAGGGLREMWGGYEMLVANVKGSCWTIGEYNCHFEYKY